MEGSDRDPQVMIQEFAFSDWGKLQKKFSQDRRSPGTHD
jgi:hypothetical protein